MSNLIYATVKGSKQGLISAGCSTLESIGNRCQVGHEDQIQVMSLDHSITYDENVLHHPVSFIKLIDKSSPLLSVAISRGEDLEVIFLCYRTNSAGQLECYYEIKLTGAVIVDVSSVYPHIINSSDMMPYEKVTVRYQTISWSHKIAGTSGYSISQDRVYY